MQKIYYLDRVIAFGSAADFVGVDAQPTGSVEQAKVELFSDSTKPLVMISDDSEAQFELFCSGFEIIRAAGGVVENPRGDILMIYRNGRWDLPKGKLEQGEALQDCAVREVEEECSIHDLTLGPFLAHSYHIYELGDRFVLKQTSWWRMSHSGLGTLTPQIEEGITALDWVTPSALPTHLENTYPTIRELLTKHKDGQ